MNATILSGEITGGMFDGCGREKVAAILEVKFTTKEGEAILTQVDACVRSPLFYNKSDKPVTDYSVAYNPENPYEAVPASRVGTGLFSMGFGALVSLAGVVLFGTRLQRKMVSRSWSPLPGSNG